MAKLPDQEEWRVASCRREVASPKGVASRGGVERGGFTKRSGVEMWRREVMARECCQPTRVLLSAA